MIKYSLGCENEHEFEGWFSTGEEFARLEKTGHLDCPICGSNKISKLLMAPSVKSTKGKEVAVNQPTAPVEPPKENLPVAAAPAMPQMPAIPAEIRDQVVTQLREMKKHVLANAENVGKEFGEEARKIHYGESEKRGIYGETSAEEAAELVEEGIDVMPLPVLPEDRD